MLERSILLYSLIPRELVPERLAFSGLKQNGRVPLPLWPAQRRTNLLFVLISRSVRLEPWLQHNLRIGASAARTCSPCLGQCG